MILLHSSGLALAALLPLLAPSQDGLPPVQVPDLEGMDPELVTKIKETVALVLATPADGEAHAQLGLVYEANTVFLAAAKSYQHAIALGEENLEHRFEVIVRGGETELGRALRVTPDIRVDDAIELELRQLYVTVEGKEGRVSNLTENRTQRTITLVL